MPKPMIRIHNANTGEIIDREMTNAEYAVHEKSLAELQARIAEKSAKAEAKAALLERLGITAEEAKLLLG